MSIGSIVKAITTVDVNGNPVTIEFRDSRYEQDINDPEGRRLLELVTQLLTDIRDQGARQPDFTKVGGLKLIGADSNSQATVLTDGSAIVYPRTARPDILGAYAVGYTVGVGPNVAVSSGLLSFRNAGPNLALVTRVTTTCLVTTGFTAAQNFTVSLRFIRQFTASDSGGFSILPSANQGVKRSSYRSTTMADLRESILGTALTLGTGQADATPLAQISGLATTAAGILWNQTLIYDHGDMTHTPLIIGPNEGFRLYNEQSIPAAGAIVVSGAIDWFEVPAWQ